MATPLLAETIRSKRGKDKLVILGFIYTLNNQTKNYITGSVRIVVIAKRD